jgi:tRNA(fMet)-specific endonuclease VapC
MILLDTSFLIDLFRGVPETKPCLQDEIFAVTTITCHEIPAGVKRTHARREEAYFRDFFAQTPLPAYTIDAAEESSSIAAHLAALDILIAGIARAHGASAIVTRDADLLAIGEVAGIEVRYQRASRTIKAPPLLQATPADPFAGRTDRSRRANCRPRPVPHPRRSGTRPGLPAHSSRQKPTLHRPCPILPGFPPAHP